MEATSLGSWEDYYSHGIFGHPSILHYLPTLLLVQPYTPPPDNSSSNRTIVRNTTVLRKYQITWEFNIKHNGFTSGCLLCNKLC